ncbi:MAG: ferritin-like domain-containing protein [Actinomycetota bacterium]|nr:ferritin-like domain-containing protein [Actinomycetota bacterium]
MPGPRPSRRRVLVAGATTAALLLASPAALTGCIAPAQAPEEPDPLEAPARRAEADAILAVAVAQAHPVLAEAARALAADRAAHATTLRAELHRAQPRSAPSSAVPAALPPPAPSPPANPDLASAREALTQAVRAARDEAARLVMTLPAYRAALLASVAACCATHAVRDHPDMETYRGNRTRTDPDMSPCRGRCPVLVEALQGALGAEHAAVWVYGVAGAFVAEALKARLEEAAAAHRARRNATERALIDAGVRPAPAEPGYLAPEPVTDTASALRLVITAETDAAAAWRSVVERSPADSDLRGAALDALTEAAIKATRWRATAGTTPLTVPFPGAP